MRRPWANSEGLLTLLHCSSEKSNLETSLILLQSDGISLIYKDEKRNIAMELHIIKMESNGGLQNNCSISTMNKKSFQNQFHRQISSLYFKRPFATIKNEKGCLPT